MLLIRSSVIMLMIQALDGISKIHQIQKILIEGRASARVDALFLCSMLNRVGKL
jgi:hypothetical protein